MILNIYMFVVTFSTTIYMNHNEINIDKFCFKNGVPVYNETSGFQQFKLIYSKVILKMHFMFKI